MGRHSSVFLGRLVVVLLLATACSESPGDTGDAAADDAPITDPDGCPEIERPGPVTLQAGVVQSIEVTSAEHVICPVAYETSPPTGGDHFPAWQNCGFYAAPLVDEVAVHSLEHGVVWISYAPDLEPSEVDAIAAFVSTDPHLLAAPYPGLANPIVLSAWERQVAVERISDAAVAEFMDLQLGRRSRTAPEAGASCSGAVGTPPMEPRTLYDDVIEDARS